MRARARAKAEAAVTRRACQRELAGLVRVWQRRLGLSDYRIDVFLDAPQANEQIRDAEAYVGFVDSSEMAAIHFSVLNEQRDYEEIIVHELLHVRWRLLEDALRALAEPAKTIAWNAHHLALQATALALVGKRSKQVRWAKDEARQHSPWERLTQMAPRPGYAEYNFTTVFGWSWRRHLATNRFHVFNAAGEIVAKSANWYTAALFALKGR